MDLSRAAAAAAAIMGDEKCVIQISRDINTGDTSTMVAGKWVDRVKSELSQLNQTRSVQRRRWEGESIYRIPWSLKKLRTTAYHPQTVSIGPYHHGAKSLKAMEKHKHRALLNFLDRRKEKPLQCYVNAVAEVVDELMAAYDQLQFKWKQDAEKFLELMIVDGCFLLELMETEAVVEKAEELKRMGYEVNDPVFSRHGHLYFAPFLRRDMLMLENQIPLLVLNIILAVADGGDLISKQKELNDRILKFFHQLDRETAAGGGGGGCREIGKCLHILDLYRKSLLLEDYPESSGSRRPKIGRSKSKVDEKVKNPYSRSATELYEAGIRFAKSETTKLNDISFYRGVLKLPEIEVDDALESEYLNMMALERFRPEAGSEVTSYVFLMDKIIDDAKDVSILHWSRILRNSLGNDGAVADLFNSLSTETCLDPKNKLYEVQEEVTRYYRNPRRRCMAYAKHNYCPNTWVFLSIVAAVFIFVITIVQTAYAVLDYHRSGQK